MPLSVVHVHLNGNPVILGVGMLVTPSQIRSYTVSLQYRVPFYDCGC